MRIISGNCRGRKLVQIQGKDIRPTSDRVREALFNIIGLMSGVQPFLICLPEQEPLGLRR